MSAVRSMGSSRLILLKAVQREKKLKMRIKKLKQKLKSREEESDVEIASVDDSEQEAEMKRGKSPNENNATDAESKKPDESASKMKLSQLFASFKSYWNENVAPDERKAEYYRVKDAAVIKLKGVTSEADRLQFMQQVLGSELSRRIEFELEKNSKTTSAEMWKILDDFFRKEVPKELEEQKLNLMRQNEGEDVGQFANRLSKQARLCEIDGEERDKEIKKQFLYHTKEHIRLKLNERVAQNPNMSLAEFIGIARAAEQSYKIQTEDIQKKFDEQKEQLATIQQLLMNKSENEINQLKWQKGSHEDTATHSRWQTDEQYDRNRFNNKRRRDFQGGRYPYKKIKQEEECDRCGSKYHGTKDKNDCKAWREKMDCRICGMWGHLARKCRNRKKPDMQGSSKSFKTKEEGNSSNKNANESTILTEAKELINVSNESGKV